MKRTVLGIMIFLIALVTQTTQAEEPTAKITPIQISLWNPVQIVPDDWDVWGLRLDILYGNNRNVYGFDVGVINRVTNNCAGIQMGIINAAKRMTGVQIGLLWDGAQQLYGVQIAGLFNGNIDWTQYDIDWKNTPPSAISHSTHPIKAIQIAGLGNMNSFSEDMTGMQIAVLGNVNDADMTGIQIAGIANASDNVTGVQIQTGLIGGNWANQMTGVQIALGISQNEAADMAGVQLALVFNKAEHMKGVQIGLVNYCEKMTGVQIGLANIIKENPIAFFPVVNARF